MLKKFTVTLGILTGTAAMIAGGAVTATAAPTEGSSTCLTAPDLRTYIPCEALRAQPKYTYSNKDGSKVEIPKGSALLAELKEEGITPKKTPAEFRDASWVLIEEYHGHKKGKVRADGSPCLTAKGSSTYALCAALWEQDSYDREDGSGLSSPTGSEIVADLEGEGVTPSSRVERFRREVCVEVRGFFRLFGG
ncbi:hypothetical protein ABT282_07295 [Streptomyces sp. NPDC000927]|uniref:hypothetical protein n=1 Tax=Streptomyces sp. NPDC000927 TaxID=3154371 RepID=UPI00332CE974